MDAEGIERLMRSRSELQEHKMDLIAPIYPPASAYHQPAVAQTPFGIDSASIAEMLGTPATRAIIAEHAPVVVSIVQLPLMKPQLNNFTARDVLSFIPGDHSDQIAKIDAALLSLPESSRPQYGK